MPTTTPTTTVATIATAADRPAPEMERRLAAAAERAARLAGQRAEMLRRREVLLEAVGRAKGRTALRPKVEEVLQKLQKAAHERSVGVYERLLTGIVADVLPGERRIVLDLGTERGLPALDIEVEREGCREGIIEGSGGSLTNIVSAGLRFAALVRSSRRRFVALDEPDCWLAPDRVPLFCAVIADISREVGVQSLIISHHDPAFFSNRTFVLRLTEDAAGGIVAVPEAGLPSWAEGQPGLRRIRIVDFMSHRDTVLILAPNVTTIVGPNNLGKSVIISALRAVAYGSSGEACIRHGAPAARVEIGIEHGRTIVWERKRKGSSKVLWRRLGPAGETEIETASGREVPDWVTADLSIAPLDDIDVQLGHQKQPVFILDRPPRNRAQILSVGRESGHLQAMLERYKETLRKDAETVRSGEAELGQLADRLAAFAGYDATHEAVRTAEAELARLARALAEAEAMAGQIARLEAAAARLAEIRAEARLLDALPELPEPAPTAPLLAWIERIGRTEMALASAQTAASALAALPAHPAAIEPVDGLAQKIERLARLAAVERLPEPPAPPEPPPLAAVAGLAAVIARIERLQAAAGLAAPPALPEAPAAAETARLAAAIALLDRLQRAARDDHATLAALTREAEAVETGIAALLARLGHLCPLCGQAIADPAHLIETGTGHD